MSIILDGTGKNYVAQFSPGIRELTWPKTMTLHMDHDFTGRAWLEPHKVEPWTGEGLPPVGVECLTDHKGETFSVKVLAYADKNGKQAVMVERTSHPECGCLHAWMAHMCNFRPIKTAEQIADEERKAGIAALHKIMDGPGYLAAAERLYNAGVRAQ